MKRPTWDLTYAQLYELQGFVHWVQGATDGNEDPIIKMINERASSLIKSWEEVEEEEQ
jgi:hypothetical protein